MNIFLRNFAFAKLYIDDIVIRFKSIQKHLRHFRTIFELLTKVNIFIKFIKIFIAYFDVIFFNQKINALELLTIKKRLKVIVKIKFSETFDDLQIYLDFTNYIENYIYLFFDHCRVFAKFENLFVEVDVCIWF